MSKVVRRELRVFESGEGKLLVELDFNPHGELVDVRAKSKIAPNNPTYGLPRTWSPEWTELFTQRTTETFWGEDFS